MERKGCNCWLWMMEAALPFSSTALSRAWPTPTGGAAPTVAGKEVVGAQPPGLGVVVQVPLDAQVVDGLEAQPRGDRRQVARPGEEGDAAQVQRGVEDVAPAGMSAPPKLGSMKYFCAICQLAHSRGLAGSRLRLASGGAGLFRGRAQIKALGEREAHLVGVVAMSVVSISSTLRACAPMPPT
jgi:hypothetical protein